MLPLSDPDIQRWTTPYVTLGIIGLSSVVFLYELLLGDLGRTVFFFRFGLIPAELFLEEPFTQLPYQSSFLDISTPFPTWTTVFTSLFIHGGFTHFAGNMLYLWVFGNTIEDRLGHARFLVFYLVCGVAATAAQVATNTSSQVPNIGASGAIAGVLGAYILLYPYSRINTLVFFYFITGARIPAIFLLGFWFLIQFFNGLGALGLSAQTSGVAYWAHIGGFVAGVAIIAVWRPPRRLGRWTSWVPPGWHD